jgi:hypothetical protein
MNDDQHRARKDHAAESLATLRRNALNIINANPPKGSNRGKYNKAGWINNFLNTLIQGFRSAITPPLKKKILNKIVEHQLK